MPLIDYVRIGNYFYPLVVLDEPPKALSEPVTKYGAMRRAYLKEHRTITYNRLLLSELLFPHLREVQSNASKRLDSIRQICLQATRRRTKQQISLHGRHIWQKFTILRKARCWLKSYISESRGETHLTWCFASVLPIIRTITDAGNG